MLQIKKKLELGLRQTQDTGETESIGTCTLKMLQVVCKRIIRNTEIKQFSESHTY